MSYWLCPRATAQPLLGLAARAAVPSKASRVPSLEALRWLSCSAAQTKTYHGTRIANHVPTRPRYSATPSVCHSRAPLGRRTFFSRRIPKKYEHVPADYQDEVGLEFRATELSQDEVNRVFPRGLISAKDANTLLRILHGRRVAGTLDDPAFASNTARFSDKQIEAALEYLRVTVPVEEALNAGLRAEDELAQIEREEAMREQGLDPSQETVSKGLSLKIKPLYKVDPVYGESRFDQLRAKNEAKSEALEAARKARQRAEDEAAGGAEALERARAGPVALVKEDGGKIMNPKIAEYYVKAQEQGDVEPEFVTFWQRVLPSATLVALVVGFLAAVTTVYEEPADTYRMVRSLSTAQATVGALIGANLLVFLGWRIPPLWGLFNRYMIFVVGKVKPVTLLTANFSHQKFSHLLMNMVPLYFVGTALHSELDRAQFLTLYVACGGAGYLTGLMFYTLRGWLSVSSLGASGCTLGIVTAYFWKHRGDGFKFLGMPEDGVAGIIFLALLLAVQVSYLGKALRSQVDLASHLGGMAMGVLGMEVVERRSKTAGSAVAGGDALMGRVEGSQEEGAEGEKEGNVKRGRSYIEVCGWWLRKLRAAHGVDEGGEERK